MIIRKIELDLKSTSFLESINISKRNISFPISQNNI